MAITEVDVIARVQDVMAGLGFCEAPWPDFSKTPDQAIDGAWSLRVVPRGSIGQIGYFEEVKATLEIAWLRHTKADQTEARDQMFTDARSILSAVVRDGTPGQYAVEDDHGLAIEFPKGATYGRADARIPINFEAAL